MKFLYDQQIGICFIIFSTAKWFICQVVAQKAWNWAPDTPLSPVLYSLPVKIFIPSPTLLTLAYEDEANSNTDKTFSVVALHSLPSPLKFAWDLMC